MIDVEATAAALYGGPSTPAPAPASAPAKASAANALYDAEPDAPGTDPAARAASRAEEKAQADAALASTYGSATRAIESAALERLDLSPAQAGEAVADWTPRFQAFGLSGTEANDLVEVAVGALAGGADQSGWASQARDALRRDYGAGAQRALESARQLVAKDPALAQFLDATGLGNHKAVISVLAAKAHHLKTRGRL